VGVVSRERSLLQAGEELILLNHYEAARELFYQLALLQFNGGARMAHLGNSKPKKKTTTPTTTSTTMTANGSCSQNQNASFGGCELGGIDIVAVIADLVESEDILG